MTATAQAPLREVDLERLLDKMALYLHRWRSDIVAYAMDMYGMVPTHQQARMLRALVKHHFVAARSGRGVGKTWVEALIVDWYVTTQWSRGKMCRVPCTANTAAQLNDVLWAALGAFLGAKPEWYRNRFVLTSERLYCKEAPETWFAVPRTSRADNPDALQGFHECCFVIDEGSEVPDEIYVRALGSLGDPHSYGIMMGNPTRPDGYFHDVFCRETFWHTMHFSSTDSLVDKEYDVRYCNAYGDIETVKVRGRQTQKWVDAMKVELGENTNNYLIHVLGELVKESQDRLISPLWVKECRAKESMQETKYKTVLGLDVAWDGTDDSALVIRRGPVILYGEHWHGDDPLESAQRAEVRYREWNCDMACVDVVGMGAGAYALMQQHGFRVMKVSAGESAPEDVLAKCHRLRDWLWWRARLLFRDRIFRFGQAERADEWDKLERQLCEPRYTIKTGVVLVETKKDMKGRGIKSPDLADALLGTLLYDCPGLKPFHLSPRQEAEKQRGRKSYSRTWATA